MDKTKVYVINTLSNMHVGSGNANCGLIDNLIQRDVLTELPCIHSSSLKGAIREHFKNDTDLVKEIFGSAPNASSKDAAPGKSRFFEASLLSVPQRSDKVPYMMVTSLGIIEEWVKKLKLFNIESESLLSESNQLFDLVKGQLESNAAITFTPELDRATIEDFDLKAHYIGGDAIPDQILTFFGGDTRRLVILRTNDFKCLCDDNHLPVLSRNNLESGVSTNLWYEQVLPRFSRLYFMFMPGETETQLLFYKGMETDLFQIGANASIGYGLCRFTDVETFYK